MAKLVIIYDSKTGNTEKTANCVMAGARSISGVEVELKKIGDPFPLSILNDANAVILGSPAQYNNMTQEMRQFLTLLQIEITDGRLNLNGKLGAAFGTYGWDGGVAIEKLAIEMEKLGLKMYSSVLAHSSSGFPTLQADQKKECRAFGKALSEKTLVT